MKDQKDHIAVIRIDPGNIVLLPQPTQSTGENSFAKKEIKMDFKKKERSFFIVKNRLVSKG
jgi:hypothetical protein